MKMSVREIIDAAASEAGDTGYSIAGIEEYLRWYNQAQSDFVKRTETLIYEGSLSTEANTQEYALTVTDNMMDIISVTVAGKPLFPKTIAELDDATDTWRYENDGETGEPDYFYLIWRGDKQIGFFPTPDAVYTIRYTGIRRPTIITSLNLGEVTGSDGKNYTCILSHTAAAANYPITGASYSTYWTQLGSHGSGWVTGTAYVNFYPDIPPHYHSDLIAYVAWKVMLKKGDRQGASDQWNFYASGLPVAKKQQQKMTSQKPYHIIRCPEEAIMNKKDRLHGIF